MILGIGTDLCSIDRIAGVLDRHGDRFRNRVFTERELARAARRAHEAGTLAKRWAAKEACSKALGTGLAMGIAWRDMAVSNLRSGQPTMALTGWAAERMAAMTPPGHRAVVHVTLTDDHPWAQAFVVIEAVLARGGLSPDEMAIEGVEGAAAGYVIDRPMRTRDALAPLLTAFDALAAERGGRGAQHGHDRHRGGDRDVRGQRPRA